MVYTVHIFVHKLFYGFQCFLKKFIGIGATIPIIVHFALVTSTTELCFLHQPSHQLS